MRTAPVALAYLDDEDALAEAARAVSELTHYDPEAGDACVLWCLRDPARRVHRRARRTRRVEPHRRRTAEHCGQRAWTRPRRRARRISPTTVGWWPPCRPPGRRSPPPRSRSTTLRPACAADHLRLGLDAAVRAGNDTDTVAAIAGGLLGATYGASAVPARWRRLLHGWRAGLVALQAIGSWWQQEHRDYTRLVAEPAALVRHPHDDGLSGSAASAPCGRCLSASTRSCRCAASPTSDLPRGVEQVDVRLIDSDAPADNPNLEFVLLDTVRLVEQLRHEGRTVFLHCVQAQRRTPAVAALYGARKRGIGVEQAFRDAVRGPSGRPPQPGVSRWAETPAPVGAIADLAFWICGISASFRGELLVADLPARRCDRRRGEGRRRGQ